MKLKVQIEILKDRAIHYTTNTWKERKAWWQKSENFALQRHNTFF